MKEKVIEVVKAYLDKRASEDAQFAQVYAKPNKNMNECYDYIVSRAHDENAVCVADEVVFGWAVHYFDEDNVKIDKIPCARVDTAVKLTDEEKQQAKEEAAEIYRAQCLARMKEEAKEKALKAAAKKREQREEAAKSNLSLFEL